MFQFLYEYYLSYHYYTRFYLHLICSTQSTWVSFSSGDQPCYLFFSVINFCWGCVCMCVHTITRVHMLIVHNNRDLNQYVYKLIMNQILKLLAVSLTLGYNSLYKWICYFLYTHCYVYYEIKTCDIYSLSKNILIT